MPYAIADSDIYSLDSTIGHSLWEAHIDGLTYVDGTPYPDAR